MRRLRHLNPPPWQYTRSDASSLSSDDKLHAGLQALGFGLGPRPAGAFYLYADIAPLGLEMDGLSFARQLLEEEHVAVTPGLDFGANDTQHHVRFAYTTGGDNIELALERIEQALRRWSRG